MQNPEFPTATAPIAFIDVEMSGLEPLRHEMLQLAVIRVAQPSMELLDQWSVRIRPEHLESANPVSLKVIGWSDAWASEGVPLQQAMEEFVVRTAGCILAGWNIAYDWAFLEAAMAATKTQTKIHKRILDVMSFAYGRLAGSLGIDTCGLGSVARHLGVPVEGRHDALGDALTTYRVYQALVARP